MQKPEQYSIFFDHESWQEAKFSCPDLALVVSRFGEMVRHLQDQGAPLEDRQKLAVFADTPGIWSAEVLSYDQWMRAQERGVDPLEVARGLKQALKKVEA